MAWRRSKLALKSRSKYREAHRHHRRTLETTQLCNELCISQKRISVANCFVLLSGGGGGDGGHPRRGL